MTEGAMAYCTHCGGQVVDGATYCPHCHKPLAKAGKGSTKPVLIALAVGCGCLGLLFFSVIVSAILIPNLLDALQKAKQKRTLADIRFVGSTMMSWMTDEVSSPSSGEGLPEAPTAEDLTRVLVPKYAQGIPTVDAWGNPLEFRVNPNLLDSRVLRIRSAGRDGVFQPETSELWEEAPFLSTDYDQDIVWADGYFLRYPKSPFD